MKKTTIAWTDYSWNPMSGCSKISPGCANCYAETIAERFKGGKAFPNGFEVTLRPHMLELPLRSNAPAGSKVFVCDMGDLFHPKVPFDFIETVFSIMRRRPDYVFQVLTKRPSRMLDFIARCQPKPLPHIWLGISLENNMAVYRRLEPMSILAGRHWTTFASCEPLLERLAPSVVIKGDRYNWIEHFHWVIVGGESGPKCRPFAPDWARAIRDGCDPTVTAFFMKQMGGHPDKREALASIPTDLQIREYPHERL